MEFDNQIYLIEFKYAEDGTNMDSLTNKAIKQIKDKNYGERFLNDFQAKVFGQKHLPEKRQRVYLGIGVLGKAN